MTKVGNDHSHERSGARVRIQVLHVPQCAHLDRVRAEIHRALTATGVSARIEEAVGDYPSPTVLVNGVDVTGRHAASTAACRLDLPNGEQLRAALTKATLQAGNPA